MAAGLASMVASMSRGKKAYLQYERELSEAIARLAQLREELKAAIDADAESYNAVMKAYKQAKESANADGMIDAALKQATSVPLSVAERAREVAGIAEKLRPDHQSEHEIGSDDGGGLGAGCDRGRAGQCGDQSGVAEGCGVCGGGEEEGCGAVG